MIRRRVVEVVAVAAAVVLAATLTGCADGQTSPRTSAASAASPTAVSPTAVSPTAVAGDAAAGGIPCLPSAPSAPTSPNPGAGQPSGASASRARGASAGAESGRVEVPEVTLRCLHGGQAVRLSRLRVATLVNLWSSTCAPCRRELPAFEGYAQRASGRIGVVGVVTSDRRAAAQSLIDDLGLTFGMIEDNDGRLLRALGRNTLPVTLLVAADGTIAYTYVGAALDEPALDALVRRYLLPEGG